MKIAYSPRLRMMSWTSARRLSPRRSLRDPDEAAEPGETQQGRRPEDSEAGDRTQEVQPAALADEILAAGMRAAQVDREIEQEDDADQVVEDGQRRQGGLAQRENEQPHDHEGEDRQDEDEDLVRVAVTARRLCRGVRAPPLLHRHGPLLMRPRVAPSWRRRARPAGRRRRPWTPPGRRLAGRRNARAAPGPARGRLQPVMRSRTSSPSRMTLAPSIQASRRRRLGGPSGRPRAPSAQPIGNVSIAAGP